MPYVKEKACRRWKEKGQHGGERERKGNVFKNVSMYMKSHGAKKHQDLQSWCR